MRWRNFVYLTDGEGMAKTKCVDCGWLSESMPVSPFDPLEALVGNSVDHEKCTKPETLTVD